MVQQKKGLLISAKAKQTSNKSDRVARLVDEVAKAIDKQQDRLGDSDMRMDDYKVTLHIRKQNGIIAVSCDELPGLMLYSEDEAAIYRDLPKAVHGLVNNNQGE